MRRRGVARRSAVAGLLLASATAVAVAGSGGAAMAEPAEPTRAPVRGAEPGEVVPGRYIVVLKDGKATPSETRAAASALAQKNGGKVRKVFTNGLRGYSMEASAGQVKRLSLDPQVAYVEPVVRASATGTQSSPPSWGLDRIDQVSPKLDGSYTYPGTSAAGVTAYVLDTGINITHQDFGGRASYGFNAMSDRTSTKDASDCDGHGTHVAGTVGGTRYGVAKDVKLVAVRVLDCEGSGTSEELLSGINWVTANAVKPAVANMSLGFGGNVQAVNDAVNASIASGITYAVASGNSMQDACLVSPASVPAAITVGATDKIDARAWFSNYGACVDTFAPGVSITSATIGSTTGAATLSGTSMASPHVAGAAALLLAANPTWSPSQVRDSIVTGGLSGAVHDTQRSLDRFLQVGTGPVARSSYGLKARINGRFVVADGAGTKPLIASAAAMGGWEKFDIVDAGSGYVGLRARANGRFVVADGAGTKPLIAGAAAIGGWEKFQIVHNTDGSVSLKAVVNGKFVVADGGGTLPLIASADAIGASAKFDLEAPNPIVSLRAAANGRFVAADGAGTKPLIAGAAAVGGWEKYELAFLPEGSFFTLRPLVNGKLVTAASEGTKPLIATSTTVGPAEVFDFIDYNADGSIYLRAYVDGQAITAGANPLISDRTIDWSSPTLGLGTAQKFTVDVV
ncbi:S8 family serine peptidase [Micromonospora sp. NPDC048868]|uniref:S8 family serine peptidase n=1 Tax=Micromonospora sp. NPDC048868 TaxID=3364258 RepID=UPI0037130762